MTHFLISKDSYWDGSPGQEDHDSFSDFQEIWNAPFSHPRCASPRQRRCEQHTVEENSWLFRVAPNWSGDLTPVARLSLRRFFEVKSNDFFEANFLEGDFKVSFTCIVEWIHNPHVNLWLTNIFLKHLKSSFRKRTIKSEAICVSGVTKWCAHNPMPNHSHKRVAKCHDAIVDGLGYCNSIITQSLTDTATVWCKTRVTHSESVLSKTAILEGNVHISDESARSWSLREANV